MLKLNMITDVHIHVYLLIHFSGFDLLFMLLLNIATFVRWMRSCC